MENNESLVKKRDYQWREYSPEMVTEAVSTFLTLGGSIKATKDHLIAKWGFSPSEPTLRKWLTASNEAMNLMDERTAWNLQQNVAEVMELAYNQLVQALEQGAIPPSKLPTTYAILIDKWLLLNKIRNEVAKSRGENNDIIADELLSDKNELLEELIKNKSISID